MKIKALDHQKGKKRGRTFKWHLDEEEVEDKTEKEKEKNEIKAKTNNDKILKHDINQSVNENLKDEKLVPKSIDIII